MKVPALVFLLLSVTLSGCFGGNGGADQAEEEATPTLPQDLTMDDAEVVSYNETTVVWRWTGVVRGPYFDVPLESAETRFDMPAGLRLGLTATIEVEDQSGLGESVELSILDGEDAAWCAIHTYESVTCHGTTDAHVEDSRWVVRVEPNYAPETPFELILRLTTELPESTVLDASGLPGCDEPLLDERIRMREIDAATDPNDPDRMALAIIATPPPFRDDPPSDWQMWDALARTEDGGQSWEFAMLPGWPGDTQSEPSAFHGAQILSDPIVMFLDDGTLLYSGIIVRESTSHLFVSRFAPGEMVPESTAILARGALATQGPLHQVPTPFGSLFTEKQQMALDPDTGNVYVAWEWRTTAATIGATSLVVTSTDGGRTWSDPVDLVSHGPTGRAERAEEAHQFPFPFVTPDGRVHVVWAESKSGALYQATSTDQAATFDEPRKLLDTERPGFPSVAVDRTGGPHDGTVYVAWWDNLDGTGSDVWLIKTMDNGTTWTDPVRVNQDPPGSENSRFYTTITVEPDGAVAILYMDERNAAGGGQYSAYVARSTDGGRSWNETRLAGEATDPDRVENSAEQPEYPLFPTRRTRVGDYNGLTWTENGLLAVWQDGRDGTSEVPYSTAWMCLLETRGDA